LARITSRYFEEYKEFALTRIKHFLVHVQANIMDKNISDAQLLETLKRLERFADLTDSRFRIPFTKIHFGIDAVIGLIPFVGETVGLVLSLYLLFEASKLGVPLSLKINMLRNILIDWGVGLIPILGDIADVAFKANIRNMKLLVEHINQEHQSRVKALELKSTRKTSRIDFILLVALLTGLSIYLILKTIP